MKLRSRRVQAYAALGLAALAIFIWSAWLRPIGARTGPTPVALDDGWARSTPAAEGLDDRELLDAMQRLLDRRLNVHAVLVERHGRLVADAYQGGRDRSVYSLLSVRQEFGPATIHDVRSVGKSVTSLLYGIALAEGNAPDPATFVGDAFPQLKGAASANERRIRVRHLLDVTSGLSWKGGGIGINDELRLFWKQDLPGYVLDRPMAVEPGTTFNYSGGCTALLAQIITDRTGLPIDEFANARLFTPLGIRSWEWVRDLHGRPMAFNGLRLRPRDLLKFGRLVLADGRWNGRQLVTAKWLRDSWAPGLATDVADFRYHGHWWSGTTMWEGRRVAWDAAFGNGGQRLFVIPERDLAIVTAAGAYDEVPTGVAVNRFVQEVVAAVRN